MSCYRNGSCGPYEMLSCGDCPASKPEYLEKDKQKPFNSCSLCKDYGLEKGDTLYKWSDWDGGIGFDYIRPVRFCPLCGRELDKEDDWEDE